MASCPKRKKQQQALAELFREEAEGFKRSIELAGEDAYSKEEINKRVTDMILYYQRLGLNLSLVSDEIEGLNSLLEDQGDVFDNLAEQKIKDYAQQLFDLPFQEITNELHIATEAGAEFGERLSAAFANATIDLLVFLSKVALLKTLENVFPKAGSAFRFLAGKTGGEIGEDIMKYQRGGPLPGKAGGDINLGLFHRGEWLVPASKVDDITKPILSAITFGYKKYEKGGEVGGVESLPFKRDVQIVNVISEDMLMNVIDKNKDVIVNYVGADIMKNGVTRRMIKGAL